MASYYFFDIRMKKILVLSIFILLLLTSCKTPDIYIEGTITTTDVTIPQSTDTTENTEETSTKPILPDYDDGEAWGEPF